MSLLAMVMVFMGSALRSMAQTESKIDARLARDDQMRVASHFLQQILSRVSMDRSASLTTQKLPDRQFQATADSINWVGIMPARAGMGGRHFFRLSAEDTNNGRSLVLRYAPWSPEGKPISSLQGTPKVLLEDMVSFTVEAQGLPARLASTPADWPRDWTSGWPVPNEPPERIRLVLTDQGGRWPAIVIQMIPIAQGSSATGGFTVGGT